MILPSSIQTPITTNTHTGANGRYIRCSTHRSAMGMTLEVGARIKKNVAAQNPTRGQRHLVIPVAININIMAPIGHATSRRFFATGQP
ncbi:MAG: hypothetical protein GC164_09935 [Phycisphaera sp.]|nr:hypothetical protein [Phycisphaera sp.]